MPEIKYRRILNKSFGAGGWGLIPRGPHSIIGRTLSREYALFASGRFVSCSRGEQTFFAVDGLSTASEGKPPHPPNSFCFQVFPHYFCDSPELLQLEGARSNALMRCCKDLGIASELWDPIFIRQWKEKNSKQVWVLDAKKVKKRVWMRKDAQPVWPLVEVV